MKIGTRNEIRPTNANAVNNPKASVFAPHSQREARATLPVGADGSWTSPLLPAGRYRVTARIVAGSPPTAKTAGASAVVERDEVTTVKLELR